MVSMTQAWPNATKPMSQAHFPRVTGCKALITPVASPWNHHQLYHLHDEALPIAKQLHAFSRILITVVQGGYNYAYNQVSDYTTHPLPLGHSPHASKPLSGTCNLQQEISLLRHASVGKLTASLLLSALGTIILTAKSGRVCSVQILICKSMQKCALPGDLIKSPTNQLTTAEAIVWGKSHIHFTTINYAIYQDCFSQCFSSSSSFFLFSSSFTSSSISLVSVLVFGVSD